MSQPPLRLWPDSVAPVHALRDPAARFRRSLAPRSSVRTPGSPTRSHHPAVHRVLPPSIAQTVPQELPFVRGSSNMVHTTLTILCPDLPYFRCVHTIPDAAPCSWQRCSSYPPLPDSTIRHDPTAKITACQTSATRMFPLAHIPAPERSAFPDSPCTKIFFPRCCARSR